MQEGRLKQVECADAQEVSKGTHLNAGDTAPPFSGPTQDGSTVSLADYAGKTVVLYFYPRDNTPGCTTESCAFQENLSTIRNSGAEVVGVSADSVASHLKFADKYGFEFPLIADEDTEICQAYGVWAEKSMYGKKFMGIVRSTFIIGADGVLTAVFPKVSPSKHAAEVLEALGCQ
jgi:peroxiredoxin Q/BCP